VDGTGESTRVTALASSKTSGSRCACTTSPCVPTGSCKTMSLQNVVFVHTFATQNTEDTTHIQQAIDACASNGKVLSHVTVLDPKQRVEEIARMLGGVKLTETTRKHAAEMLGIKF